ncbi:hypothetical protein ACHAXT_004302 [Thalassiosira profunda]
MAVFPVDGVASFLSFVLATLATLRAASRLERRLYNRGSIGLMDGPPILGPAVTLREQPSTGRANEAESPLDDAAGKIDGDQKDDDRIRAASPLWEHTEAFRRAVVLGLAFDDLGDASSTVFSDIIRTEGKPINVRGGSEDERVLSAAVEAGLLLPSNARIRGGGPKSRSNQKVTGKDTGKASSNPISMMTDWFVRELSAPLAAIPAWHGLVSSYFREKKENRLRKSQWCLLSPWERLQYALTGKYGKTYRPTGLDFGAAISGTAQIPAADPIPATKAVRVRAFAPKTFRDLRNKCFRVSEREYARSILNLMGGAVSAGCVEENDPISIEADTMISDILTDSLGGGRRQRNANPLPYISFQSNSKGAARAGTFFFFTTDGAYMVKTVKKEEAKAFLDMLPEYHRFMSESVNSRNSLLTRIFGMYSVQFPSESDAQPSVDTDDRWDGGLFSPSQDHVTKLEDDERVYLVMHSVFPPEAANFVTERFDLKGSTVGRECSMEERESKGANAVLKDLDLKREVVEEMSICNDDSSAQKQYGICIGRRHKAMLMAQLERDVDLLHRCNVLDYSLLVGVADMEKRRTAEANASNKIAPKALQNVFQWLDAPMPYHGAGATEVDGGALSALAGTRKGKRVIYYMGVIDFLQPWGVKKRLERDLKGLAGYDKSAISCVAPSDYAARFLKFIEAHIT